MKTQGLINLLFIFLLVGLARCDNCSTSTRETKMKNYKGKAGATEPHITQHAPKLGRWAKSRECATTGCQYTFTERVMIHNPLDKKIKVDTVCRWFYKRGGDGEYEAAKNNRKGTVVDAKASRGVELSHMVTLPDGDAEKRTTAKCEITWQPM
jgi:hypothetical protein